MDFDQIGARDQGGSTSTSADRANAALEAARAALETAALSDVPIMVLLVDDQAIVAEAVRRALANEDGIDLHYCASADEAIYAATHTRPTVILQDLVMPGIDGLTLVKAYRTNTKLRDVPIIVLSTKEEPTIKSAAFAAGANDYLVKLPDRMELVARIRYHSRSYVNLLQRDEAYRALRESQQQLLEANLELRKLTQSDGLTGLSNRRYLDEYLNAEWRRGMRAQTEVSILMIDVDNFKPYNDTYGHVAGDEVLKQIDGGRLPRAARRSRGAVRWRGVRGRAAGHVGGRHAPARREDPARNRSAAHSACGLVVGAVRDDQCRLRDAGARARRADDDADRGRRPRALSRETRWEESRVGDGKRPERSALDGGMSERPLVPG
jgi:PleD family two-component response regulator